MSHEEKFAIKTEAFEGPLELLLDLIEKRKLLINDISLASVTDEYMTHVEKMQENKLPHTAQFVLIASTLLLIKSKSLLPILELTDEEEQNIEDLERRLKLYQIYKTAGKNIQSVFGSSTLYNREFIKNDSPLFVTDKFTETSTLLSAIKGVLVHLPKKVKKQEVSVKTVISLEESINQLHERITRQFKLKFTDFTKHEKERGNVIVSFLAVLELVKQGTVMVHQEVHFGDFHIEKESAHTPNYG